MRVTGTVGRTVRAAVAGRSAIPRRSYAASALLATGKVDISTNMLSSEVMKQSSASALGSVGSDERAVKPLKVWVKKEGDDHYIKLNSTATDISDLLKESVQKLKLMERPTMLNLHPVKKVEGKEVLEAALDTRMTVGDARLMDGDNMVVKVVQPPPPPAKRFTLLVPRTNEYDEIVAVPLPVSALNDDRLDKLIVRNGGGNLVLVGSTGPSVEGISEIQEGATYQLIGGSQEARMLRIQWTQVSDKVFEEEATQALVSDTTNGPLQPFTNYDAKDVPGESTHL